MGEWAWAAGICPLLGPWRRGAVQCVYQREGGFDPHRQLAFLSRHEVTNVFATPTAIRSMMSIADARTRYPQRFRIVCSAGEPLNPEAIRWFREQYGGHRARLLRAHRVLPAVRQLPLHGGPRGLDGPADAGLGVAILDPDEQPVAAGERGEICLRARSNPHYPLGYWRLPEASEETFGGEWFHTKDAARMDEDGYVWYEGRADDVIISAGYRIGPFEVESACLEHPAVAEAAAVAAPDERRGNVVKAFVVLAAGREGSDELAEEIKAFVRERLSAYAYPRIDRVRRRACRRRSPARSAGSSCASARPRGPRARADALRCGPADRPLGRGRLGRPAGKRSGASRWPVPVVGSVTPPRLDTKPWDVVVQRRSVIRHGWGGLRAPPPTSSGARRTPWRVRAGLRCRYASRLRALALGGRRGSWQARRGEARRRAVADTIAVGARRVGRLASRGATARRRRRRPPHRR